MANSHKNTTRADAHPPGEVTASMLMDDQGSDPSSPAASKKELYVKSDGLYLKNSAGTVVGPLIDAAGAGTGAPTTAKYVTSAANGTLSAEVVIPGLAGSADVASVGGAGTSREFESGDSAPTWSPSGPAASDVGTTIASHLYAQSTDSTERLGLYAWAPAGAFDARMKLTVGSESAATAVGAGLVITDSGNSNRALVNFGPDLTNFRYLLQAFTFASSAYTQRGNNWAVATNEIYLRITRDGSNNVAFYWSVNGTAWQFIATLSFTFTVANIGLRLGPGGAVTFSAAADFLRTSV